MSCRSRLSVLCFTGVLAFAVFPHSIYANSRAKEDVSKEVVVKATTLEAFEKDVVALRKSIDDGRFSVISKAERASVEKDLGEIGDLLESKGSVDRMNEVERIRVINAQERANATLLKNDGDRLVCEFRRGTGSKRKERFCSTVLEMKKQQEAGRREMESLQGRGRPTPPGR